MVRKTILEGWVRSFRKRKQVGDKKEDQLSCYNVFNSIVKFIVCNL